ncbi:MAG: GTPase/DUF3482 domain-containing protein [Hyphomicrobiales bacterium]|nr:GTPase/DUF3482 domain-containing protein [Hyphomicrobiales bacterium]MCP5373326.1 GTPase/DUF3482 domain-containing protein [Hyphomicrobiales bacterium]
MAAAPLKVAVVGHTNTGKTSLLRTLTRDVDFGQVSNRPATTRHVEASTLLLDGRPAVELFDTPGLEDSAGLLERLEGLRRDRGVDWTDAILAFLAEPALQDGFAQEAKVLRQMMASDAALYVVDARDRVLGKHRDELEILGRCARPILPVLNFVADPEAREEAWRDHLARVNMHAVVAFDTVVFDEAGERNLFAKMRTLMDRHAAVLDALVEDAGRRRQALRRASAEVIADLLIDVAGHAVAVPSDDPAAAEAALERLRAAVRAAEQGCVTRLLDLHRFRPGDYLSETLPLTDGRWGTDLFSAESLAEFGITTGSAAATGALAGLAIDAMVGGMTLGAAAATGALIGAVAGAAKSRGREIVDSLRGVTELRVDAATLDLLARRQTALVRALLRRGHAAQERVRLAAADTAEWPPGPARDLRGLLAGLRHRADWSRLASPGRVETEGGRAEARDRLSDVIVQTM